MFALIGDVPRSWRLQSADVTSLHLQWSQSSKQQVEGGREGGRAAITSHGRYGAPFWPSHCTTSQLENGAGIFVEYICIFHICIENICPRHPAHIQNVSRNCEEAQPDTRTQQAPLGCGSSSFLPAMRMTALSAGSSTSPEADLERFMRWCLGRFQGNVSPGDEQQLGSLDVSSDEALVKGFFLGPDTSSMVWMGKHHLAQVTF